ncbi:MAG: heavy metal translocating P-type ATPase [Bacteroidia bacterium]
MQEPEQNTILHIEGMDCANCAAGITKSLKKNGMENVFVDFASGEATFFLSDKKKLSPAIKSIHDLGYKVLDARQKAESETGMSVIEKRFWFTVPFTAVLFFSHMLLPHDFFLNQAFVQLALCMPVLIVGILQFGKSAWGSVRIGVPNMDVLIFIGSSSAFVYSLAGMYLYSGHELHNYLFFETTSTIITLVLLGNVLEHRSVKQTTSAIRDLSAMNASKAKMIGLQFGKEVITEVAYKDITAGALLAVNTGDRIPVDGEIYEGAASIDESMLTGESMPVDKQSGDKVTGGTVVLDGNFRMRAEKVGNETTLSKIIDMVKKAQQAKPEIQKLGDRISAIFVPAVLSISILTFCISFFTIHISMKDSLMHSIAVLVISCPCAMGLATPTAVMAGIGRAAKRGILIKGGNTLELFANAETIVFDKTGTLTSGNFKLRKIHAFENTTEQEVRSVIAELEKYSSHPIAVSLVKELKDFTPQAMTAVEEEKGMGISGTAKDGKRYRLGSFKAVKQLTTDDTHSLYLTEDNRLIAFIDIEDELKMNAAESIASLKKEGIRPIMLSGDSKAKCDEVAAKTGITEVYCEQSPEQKLEIIAKYNSGNKAAMVGDGINDAPALAKASVGISMSNATQVAIQSAQIILLKSNDLRSLEEARLISKHTLLTIKQNLFWAFCYNIIAIPVAAAGFLNPMAGALTMAFSDVIVIGNSIRLKTKRLR